MALTQADMDQLNSLAGKLEEVGNAIDAVDIRTALAKVREALVACDIVPVCDQAGEFIEGAYLRVAERERSIATKIRTCATDFAMTDQNFKKALDEFDFHGSGAR
ncbi:hypothetical protein NDR87_32380 [Nocardia sp. CDC159]|uniref:Excreted virulence factor EspC (Type VII ESX diderm) n=1 Tax=Nocardia pulmonis TaxID=2951408 RepID=A0A9X2ED71_9NOCA|nr:MULTISPECIES: hypothetical protein [Nocardia]MCM6778190.1 hypothetical protein [Nocardia pulmonis]MCM6791079.1 hypothetical protein [Nocardia sp. CDC159]